MLLVRHTRTLSHAPRVLPAGSKNGLGPEGGAAMAAVLTALTGLHALSAWSPPPHTLDIDHDVGLGMTS